MFHLTPWTKKERNVPTVGGDYPLARMRDEFEALFNRFFGTLPALGGDDGGRFWALDLDDTGKEYVVRAEAPGFEAKDFELELSGNTLMLKAEKKEEKKGKGKEGVTESRYASFQRMVTLPEGFDRNRIEATYRNGVLEVHLPKTPEAAGKRIEVKG